MEHDSDFERVPASGPAEASGHTPRLWITGNFAEHWFRDAKEESGVRSDWNARRREILFAVCCAESYIVEWTRDIVGNGATLDKYLLRGERRRERTLLKKWKKIPRKLFSNGLISGVPDWSDQLWCEWKRLVEMRNELVHARTARPYTGEKGAKEPRPTRGDLDQLQGGWASDVVSSLIKRLNTSAGLQSPSWVSTAG